MVDHVATVRDADMRSATYTMKEIVAFAMTSERLEHGEGELKTFKRLAMFKFYQKYLELVKEQSDRSPAKTEAYVKVHDTDA
jgi:hypothetical protein